MDLISSNIHTLEVADHWVYVFAKLNPKEKGFLKRYYSTLYPREYVRKLVAYLDTNVQFKGPQNSERFGSP